MDIWQYIKEYRQKVLHMTQDEAANMCGVSTRAFQSWESGEKIPRASSISLLFYNDPTSENEAQMLRLKALDEKNEGTPEEGDKNYDERGDFFASPSDEEIEKLSNDSYPQKPGYIKSILRRCFGLSFPDTPSESTPEVTEEEIFSNTQNIRPFYNMAIFGASGSGKTLKIKNHITNNTQNMIITDPSGEIKESMESVLKDAGYTVKEFDIRKTNFDSVFGPIKDTLVLDSEIYNANFEKSIWGILSQGFFSKNSDPFWAESTRFAFTELLNEYKSISECLKHVQEYEYKQNLAYLMPEKTMQTIKMLLATMLESLTWFDDKQSDLTNILNNLIEDTEKYLEGGVKYAYFLTGQVMEDNRVAELNLYCILKMLEISQQEVTSRVTGGTDRMSIPPVTLYVDNAAEVLSKENLEFLVTCSRKNIRYVLVFQDLNQVKEKFGSKWDMVCGNLDIRIFLPGVYDVTTEEYISNACGKTTVIKSAPGCTQSVSEHKVIDIPQIENLKRGEEIVISRSYGAYICKDKNLA